MAEVTYEPANPIAGKSGVLITVTGEVTPDSVVILTDEDERIRHRSVVFGQGLIPLGTGDSQWNLRITGGTSGTFELDVYEYGDDPVTTDAIYYYNDSPTYAYPDSDDLIDAIEAALPGSDVTVERDGPALTLLVGGKYSGRRVMMTIDAAGIGGSETATLTQGTRVGGPFLFGPLILQAGTYEVDVVEADDDDASQLDDTVEIEVVEE